MRLFDTHCHFDFAAFDADRDAVMQRGHQRGVSAWCVPGIEPQQWSRLPQFARDHPGTVFAVGLHPWWLEAYLSGFKSIDRAEETLLVELRRSSADSACRAIGEFGLDALRGPPLALQQRFAAAQLSVACALDRPVILHCVRAHAELLTLLKASPPLGGVVHGFSGSAEMAEQYWRLGLRIGVGGSITYERAAKTRRAVCRLPAEALVLETDAPDMPIAGRQGERNSPEYLPDILHCLATLRGEDATQLAAVLWQTSCELFTLQNCE